MCCYVYGRHVHLCCMLFRETIGAAMVRRSVSMPHMPRLHGVVCRQGVAQTYSRPADLGGLSRCAQVADLLTSVLLFAYTSSLAVAVSSSPCRALCRQTVRPKAVCLVCVSRWPLRSGHHHQHRHHHNTNLVCCRVQCYSREDQGDCSSPIKACDSSRHE